MPPQNDEANLARIRDNQRRSRARRKEYQQELEQRVRAFEELGVEASTEVQQAARRVAEENRKLRALLQSSGISHASIEAYLQTGDVSAAMATTAAATVPAATPAAATAAHASALDHLMVARFPAHYVSPLGGGGSGALSVSGSVGPSSPAGGSVGGGDGGAGGGGDWEASIARDVGVMATHASTSSPPGAMRSIAGRASGSHRSSHRSSFDSKGKRHVSSALMPAGDYTASGSSSTTAATAATTNNNTNSDYLTGYGLSNAFYGLDGASTEELQYTGNEPPYFDYSASPHYYGGSGGGGGASALPGMSQAPGAAAYYGHVPSILSSSGGGACPACLSGMGCQVHGFFEE